MKIRYKKGMLLRSFSAIRIECSDKMMAETLAAGNRFPHRKIESYLHSISEVRKGHASFFEYCFESGAKLKIDMVKGGFYIYGYSQLSQDSVRAVSELKTMNHLRQAAKHYLEARPKYERTYDPDFHNIAK